KSIPLMMAGKHTISGNRPTKYVSPRNLESARAQIKHTSKQYFDYGNHSFVGIVVKNYFKDGYPFEPHLGSMNSDLDDILSILNDSSTISASKKKPLEALVIRIFGAPRPGVSVYDVLVAIDPLSLTGDSVFGSYKGKLVAAVSLIAQG